MELEYRWFYPHSPNSSLFALHCFTFSLLFAADRHQRDKPGAQQVNGPGNGNHKIVVCAILSRADIEFAAELDGTVGKIVGYGGKVGAVVYQWKAVEDIPGLRQLADVDAAGVTNAGSVAHCGRKVFGVNITPAARYIICASRKRISGILKFDVIIPIISTGICIDEKRNKVSGRCRADVRFVGKPYPCIRLMKYLYRV